MQWDDNSLHLSDIHVVKKLYSFALLLAEIDAEVWSCG